MYENLTKENLQKIEKEEEEEEKIIIKKSNRKMNILN
jgi:hypothetical protein